MHAKLEAQLQRGDRQLCTQACQLQFIELPTLTSPDEQLQKSIASIRCFNENKDDAVCQKSIFHRSLLLSLHHHHQQQQQRIQFQSILLVRLQLPLHLTGQSKQCLVAVVAGEAEMISGRSLSPALDSLLLSI
uniref:Uncharacterized protein n=1 Tax=Oryza sativa subsp. japonica TaxID=39947 RepID=Q6YVX6_ORYSJ|nr:hypothetical protein [Oryza sativa Japonica Group]